MGRASRGKVITATGATVATALATGGVALASGDGAAPEIHGCANSATGALRIARHCAAGEHPVAWNQLGPAGPQGFRGPPGPSGTAGSGGPAAWTVTLSSPVLIGTSPTPVLTAPTLPGSASGTNYVVSAVVSVQDVSSGSISVTCTLSLGSQSYPDTMTDPVSNLGNRQSSLNLALGAQIASAQAPSLSCVLNGGSDSLTVQRAELTVVQVGALS